MPGELFDVLNVKGDASGAVGVVLTDFWTRLTASEDVGAAIDSLLSLIASQPVIASVIILAVSAIILIIPSAVSRPLSMLYSALLGFSLTVAYLPVGASENLSATVLAVILGLVCLVAHRLVSLISYFVAVGALAYVGAFSGALLGFGEGDIFLSLIISAVVILASLMLISPARIAGVCLFGGYLASLAISLLVDFAILFGGAGDAVSLGISFFFALLGIKRCLKRRGGGKAAEGRA